jgi:phosphomannomutase
MDCVDKVNKINSMNFSEAITQEKIELIGKEVDEAYQNSVLKESLVTTRSAKIVYSPLHGTGITSVLPILEQAGFTLSIIKEQATPDGHFPNLPNNIPNPEVPTASKMVLKYAAILHADIGITTDPDADRLGLIARDKLNNYVFLNGNQIAFLICAFTLEQMHRQGKLKGKQFMATTIVTTDGLRALANSFGVNMYGNLLIGFKYVAEKIRELEGQEQFIIGGEESHGLLKGTYTRDKDAAVAALLVSELASVLKDDGKTVPDYLDELYKKYGVFCEKLQNIIYEGAEGSKKMASIMERLRSNPPLSINGHKVMKFTDRLSGLIINPQTKELIGKNDGTPGDVLIFSLAEDDGVRVTVRPSGTEPKLKVYTQVHLPIINGDLNETKKETESLSQQLLLEVTALCK